MVITQDRETPRAIVAGIAMPNRLARDGARSRGVLRSLAII